MAQRGRDWLRVLGDLRVFSRAFSSRGCCGAGKRKNRSAKQQRAGKLAGPFNLHSDARPGGFLGMLKMASKISGRPQRLDPYWLRHE